MPYSPTHLVPSTGLDAYGTPDASAPATARLEPWLDIQLLRTWGSWAEVVCSNGWTCWVDGRSLAPRGPAPTVSPLLALPATPTAAYPAQQAYPQTYGGPSYGGPSYGGRSYAGQSYGGPAYPQPGYPAPAYPPPGYGGQTYGGPAYPAPGPGTVPHRRAVPVPGLVASMLGAAAVVGGALLPWLRVPGLGSANSADVPVRALLDLDSPGTGPFSVMVLVVGAAIVTVLTSTWRPTSFLRRLAGTIVLGACGLFTVQMIRSLSLGSAGAPSLFDVMGIGVVVTGIGGLILLLAPRG